MPVISDPITDWGAALPLGAVNLIVLSALAVAVLPSLARAHARCCLAVLAPSPAEHLVERVTELTRTRADVLQAHSAELRRIERDLHDGTQARLVSIAMRLAVAGDAYAHDPDSATALVRQAHAETEEAMTELRSVIHTIYPPVLADQGLSGALTAVATRAGVPTRLDIGPLGEVPAAVEAVAYFAATEALANIAWHSGATGASIRVHLDGALLRVRITDNGAGGADAARGSGLDGMRRRAGRQHGPQQSAGRTDRHHRGAAMRVVIAEDNVLLSSGLELLLKSKGFAVAAIATDAPGFLAAVEAHKPDATIVDVRLPPGFRDEGIRAALQARRDHPGLPILVLSQYVEQEYATRLLANTRGGIGYLLKDRVSRVVEFTEALRRVADGGTAMDPEVIAQLLAHGDPIDALTAREREVLALMAEGHDNATIAGRLFITGNAVHKHIGNVFLKLGLSVEDSGHRRVLAVLAYLRRHGGAPPTPTPRTH